MMKSLKFWRWRTPSEDTASPKKQDKEQPARLGGRSGESNDERRTDKQRQRWIREQEKRDKELIKASENNLNPAISADSDLFRDKLRHFGNLLRSQTTTIERILRTEFTPLQRTLLIPADKKRNPVMFEIQARNKQAYSELLRSGRFSSMAGQADLAFKFTLAWFGVSVSPMTINFNQRWKGWEDSDDSVDEMAPDPEGGLLRFMNCYQTRAFEKDVIRKPDPQLEAYYTIEQRRRPGGYYFDSMVGLRGGGADEDHDDGDMSSSPASDWEPSALDSASQARSDVKPSFGCQDPGPFSLRGGGGIGGVGEVFKEVFENAQPSIKSDFSRTEKLADREVLLGGEMGGANPSWIPLYGNQGIVWFRLDSFYSFIDAVDRVLGLDTRAGVNYTLHIRRKDKKSVKGWERFHVICAGVGDYSGDHPGWKWVQGQLGQLGQDAVTDRVIFISPRADQSPDEWEPSSASNVLKVLLRWPAIPELNRPDVAYIRMAENFVPQTNLYAEWVASACRLLAAGRIPNRPGQPAIPDASIGLLEDNTSSYGGLLLDPRSWQDMENGWQNDHSKPVVLMARARWNQGGTRDHLPIFLPSGTRDHSLQLIDNGITEEALSRAIVAYTKECLGLAEAERLWSVQVYVIGQHIYPSYETKDWENAGIFTLPVNGKTNQKYQNEEQVLQEIRAFLETTVNWLRSRVGSPPNDGLHLFPQFTTIVPRFRTYLAVDPRPPGKQKTSFEWDLDTTLEEFRDRVSTRLYKNRYDPTRDVITIREQARISSYMSSSTFVISPRTTDAQWEVIRRFITKREVNVTLEGEEPRFSSRAFGYMDIYTAPGVHRRPTDGPTPHRNFDHQLWSYIDPNAKVAGSKPLMPWDKQPPPRPPAAQGRKPAKPGQGGRVGPAGQGGRTNQGTAATKPDREMSDIEKGMFMRQYSYAHPLDVQMQGGIPINAPPIDTLLNLGYDNLPTVALSVLTPTETRRLQRDYHNIRNILLSRAQQCPHAGCDVVIPVSESGRMQQHLWERHAATKCPFCIEPLFEHWSLEQRAAHCSGAHYQEFVKFIGTGAKTGEEKQQQQQQQEKGKKQEQTPGKKRKADDEDESTAAGRPRPEPITPPRRTRVPPRKDKTTTLPTP
ncbi:hypothetical protein B0H63DRAFT_449476 [Podospora didyma]|uniref:Uncharacterized protein n=1 Tax=Podospora didyma TaxID=330526 RepID=A0AAE0NPS2_9PEZI|nr:hypothetical protein B0H63DRAFT_449476 [Podospora didyma]